VRLGAQLRGADGTLINRDFARAHLPRTINPGETMAIDIELPPMGAGQYQLTLDLVNEGIDWFEACGSPTVTISLVVS
jgi:hypothetical protein